MIARVLAPCRPHGEATNPDALGSPPAPPVFNPIFTGSTRHWWCAPDSSQAPYRCKAARFSVESLTSKLVNSMAAMDVVHPQTYQQRSSFDAAGPVRLCLVAAAWNACPCWGLLQATSYARRLLP